ncbi:MAG: S8 family serine peptidase, partial [Pseudomonadota bacterium]
AIIHPDYVADPAGAAVTLTPKSLLGPDKVLAIPAPLRKRAIPDGPCSGTPHFDATANHDDIVLVGIIDDGINIAHERFTTVEGGRPVSRVDFAWLQDGIVDQAGCVPFGREWKGREISDVLCTARDEDDALRRLGLIDFERPGRNHLANAASHGTFVMDVAAGARSAEAETARRIVAVQLPTLVAYDVSGQQLGPFCIAGLKYIFERRRLMANEIGKKVPLVVNISYGVSGGPHDGTHFVEEAIERLIASERAADHGPVEVVLPCGNRNLDRCAAACEATAGITTLTTVWKLPPDDETSSYLEAWLPAGATDLSVEVDVPGVGAATLSGLSEQAPQVLMRGADRSSVVARIVVDRPQLADDAGPRQRVLLSVAPTDAAHRPRERAPHGRWRVKVSARISEGERIEAWVLRDHSTVGYRSRGRQSAFDDPLYERFGKDGDVQPLDPDSLPAGAFVRRSGSTSGLASGASTRIVGASVHTADPLRIAHYSATAATASLAPDLSAAADRSLLRSGLVGSGTMSGSTQLMNGTSLAAPQLVRALAAAYAHDPACNAFEKVCATLTPIDDAAQGRRSGRGILPLDEALALRN